MKAITVCVEYDDLLAISLPENARHFDRMLVVTSPTDHATTLVANSFENVLAYHTDAFYRRGADFNKGLALEEGFNVLGRDGWICILDADTVLPRDVDFSMLEIGKLYCPKRRILTDPTQWSRGLDWSTLPTPPVIEHAGYCQIFHADDPIIKGLRPWYGTNWRHAGGCDSDFHQHWPPSRKIWLPWEVLHLGPHGKNWYGRYTARLDGSEPDHAAQRREAWHQMWKDRRKHGFTKEKLP